MRQYNTQLQQVNREKHEDAIEDLTRSARSKNLVLYHFPEEIDGIKVDVQSLVKNVEGSLIDSTQRLGRLPTKHGKPRPLRACFTTLRSKHEFLTHAKELRETLGIRCDDDLTRKQQQQREELSADFLSLKAKRIQSLL